MDGSIFRRHALAFSALAAIAMGLVSYVAAERHLGARERDAAARLARRYAEVEVVVAARDQVAGAQLDAGMLAVRRIPVRFAPATFVAPERAGELIGTTLRVAMRAGDVVQWTLVGSDDPRPLADRIAPGQRALTIPVDDVNSFAGLLRPGDRIDLLLTGEGIDAATAVRSLLENVLVLATGRALRDDADAGGSSDEQVQSIRAFSTVTVAVSPRDAERIALAQRLGGLSALLRHRADPHAALDPVLTAAGLFPDRHPRVRRAERPRDYVQLIVGGFGAQRVMQVAAHEQ